MTFSEGLFAKFFDNMQSRINDLAHAKGFWDWPHSEGLWCQKLCRLHEEVSETFQTLKEGKLSGEELADVIIVAMDLAEEVGINLGEEIVKKYQKNKGRKRLHGKSF